MKKLNEKRKDDIKKWLKKSSKKDACPFNAKCRVCARLFPEVIMVRKKFDEISCPFYLSERCPCDILGVKEVVRRAKEWVK